MQRELNNQSTKGSLPLLFRSNFLPNQHSHSTLKIYKLIKLLFNYNIIHGSQGFYSSCLVFCFDKPDSIIKREKINFLIFNIFLINPIEFKLNILFF